MTLTQLFTSIANAIRTKKGTEALIQAEDFADEISTIETGITPTGTINITTNGITDVTNYASANVNIEQLINMNLFIQNAQPTGKYGIWIKANSLSYNKIIEIASENNIEANAINIVTDDKRYNTRMYTGVDGGLTYYFRKVLITDNNNNIDYNHEIYYGNGNTWVDITPIYLPYILLEYIESTGTQYIDTGIAPNLNTKTIIDFNFTGRNNVGIVFGSRAAWNSRGYWVGTLDDTLSKAYWYQFGTNSKTSNTRSNTDRHTISFSKTGVIIDNVTDVSLSGNSFEAYTNLLLFKSIDGSTTRVMTQRLYSLKVYDNNTLVRDFIPVKRKSDNAICLYDNVTGTFYTNSGTGTFIEGPVIN